MTLMMMFVAPMLTGMPMDIAAMLGGMLGGYTMGMIAHIMMGVVVFPIAYVIGYNFIPGSPLVKGLLFGVVLWIAAVVMVMPMAGAGFLMANIGGMMAVMAALMGHLVYGGLLGVIANGSATAKTA
jgi:uncharacterized membrane protein YagU involved in acid resistance